jgi:hypothetical protein
MHCTPSHLLGVCRALSTCRCRGAARCAAAAACVCTIQPNSAGSQWIIAPESWALCGTQAALPVRAAHGGARGAAALPNRDRNRRADEADLIALRAALCASPRWGNWLGVAAGAVQRPGAAGPSGARGFPTPAAAYQQAAGLRRSPADALRAAGRVAAELPSDPLNAPAGASTAYESAHWYPGGDGQMRRGSSSYAVPATVPPCRHTSSLQPPAHAFVMGLERAVPADHLAYATQVDGAYCSSSAEELTAAAVPHEANCAAMSASAPSDGEGDSAMLGAGGVALVAHGVAAAAQAQDQDQRALRPR